jgi:hypothetical protein
MRETETRVRHLHDFWRYHAIWLNGSEYRLARSRCGGGPIHLDREHTVPNDPDLSTPYRFSSLANKGAMVRVAVIGAAALGVVVCFAFVAGWLSPAA